MRDNRDILEKLRATVADMEYMEVPGEWLVPVEEAKAEITGLRADNERLEDENKAVLAANRDVMLHWDVLKADYERLRAALETISLMDKKHEHDLFSATQVARAALDGQPAPSGWRPIETAPREPGKYLLGWNGHHCGVIQYWERKYEEDPEWVDEHTEFIDPPISHWMPLPPAPGKEGA